MVASHFFRGALAQLRIHISLVARFEGAEETVAAAHFFRGALAQLRIHLSLVARFEAME